MRLSKPYNSCVYAWYPGIIFSQHDLQPNSPFQHLACTWPSHHRYDLTVLCEWEYPLHELHLTWNLVLSIFLETCLRTAFTGKVFARHSWHDQDIPRSLTVDASDLLSFRQLRCFILQHKSHTKIGWCLGIFAPNLGQMLLALTG